MQRELLSTLLEKFHRILHQSLTASPQKGLNVAQTPPEVQALLPKEPDFEVGNSPEKLLSLIQKYLDSSVNTRHTHFMNQLWSGFSLPGYLGETLGATTNTSMYTFEVAPLATIVEKQIIAQVRKLIGFSYAEGTFVPGGSYGNLVGLLLARNRCFPQVKKQGNQQAVAVFCSQEAHYSILKASNILGLGEDAVYKVPCDQRGRMSMSHLKSCVQKSQDDGRTPIAIVATSGTTVRGAFDPLEEIADFSKQEDIWLHVDATLGGSFLFSEKKKDFLKGMEKANSMVWNFHKMLGVPLHCSLFLTTHPRSLLNHCGLDKKESEYIFHDEIPEEEEILDLGHTSLQCGRKADVLKIWLAWYLQGTQGLARQVEHTLSLAEYAEEWIHQSPHLKMIVPRESICVCFQFVDSKAGIENSKKEQNALNQTIRDALLQSGKLMINYGWFNGQLAIRLAPLNADLQKEHIEKMLQMIVHKGQELLQSQDA